MAGSVSASTPSLRVSGYTPPPLTRMPHFKAVSVVFRVRRVLACACGTCVLDGWFRQCFLPLRFSSPAPTPTLPPSGPAAVRGVAESEGRADGEAEAVWIRGLEVCVCKGVGMGCMVM